MKKVYMSYIVSVLLAPVIFWIYLAFDLVCAPRAVFFEVATGALSVGLLTLAYRSKKAVLLLLSLFVPVFVIISSPVIMVSRLGAEKFLSQRLLAYSTFEIFAIFQLILISILIGMNNRSERQREYV
jgi:hypothetical protein